MSTGLGTAPIGATPFGFGLGEDAPEPPSGESGTRYINPSTGDYEQDSFTRQLKQMPAVRQRILIKLSTARGSSSVLPLLGAQFPRKMDQTFERRVKDSIRVALRQETEVERVCRIDNIGVERSPLGRAIITVSYTDLTTGDPDVVRI